MAFPRLGEQVDAVRTGLYAAETKKVAQAAAQTSPPVDSTALNRLLQIFKTKKSRRELTRLLGRASAEAHLPASASASLPAGSTRTHYQRMIDLLRAIGGPSAPPGFGEEITLLESFVKVLDGLAAHVNSAVREISATFPPSFLRDVRKRLGLAGLAPGTIVEATPERFEGLMWSLAGLSAESDLVPHPGLLKLIEDVIEEMSKGVGLPDDLVNVEFDLSPLVVRRVTAPNLQGRPGQAYVDIQVAFRGTRLKPDGHALTNPDGSAQIVYYFPLRAQSKLTEGAADLFTHIEDDVLIVGQLRKDDLRWDTTGDIGLNGAPIPRELRYQPKGGQRVVGAAARDITPAERASAAAEGILLIPLLHRHGASDYVETALALMSGLGLRKAVPVK